MKLGTHNSLSYLKPQWWLRPFRWIAQCQTLTIEEQYELGVRWFDIRIRCTKKGLVAGHGAMTYKCYLSRIFKYLNDKGDCIVNIVLENGFWQGDKYDDIFRAWVLFWKDNYTSITWVGGDKKNPWTNLIQLSSIQTKSCFEFFNKLKWPCPKYWAKKKNNQYWKELNDEVYTIMDFVEIDK